VLWGGSDICRANAGQIKALALSKIDALGFSIGGFVAQQCSSEVPPGFRRPRQRIVE
jgi:hypothetical protein